MMMIDSGKDVMMMMDMARIISTQVLRMELCIDLCRSRTAAVVYGPLCVVLCMDLSA